MVFSMLYVLITSIASRLVLVFCFFYVIIMFLFCSWLIFFNEIKDSHRFKAFLDFQVKLYLVSLKNNCLE